jgi:predicted secreted hydrolase
MKTSKFLRRRTPVILAALTVAAIAVPAAAATATAHSQQNAPSTTTAAPSAQPGPTADPGFPTFAHLPADQAAQPNVDNDWWYTIGHIWAGRHEYGYEVQLTASGLTEIALTDVTSDTYASQQILYTTGQFSVSTTGLDVQMPDASLSGPLNDMHLKADLPHGMGTLDLTLDAVGPTLYDNGTGLFPILGGTSYYYSLPNLRTAGTLTVNGTTQHVTGLSWLDRQWGTWDWTQLHRWTWMALQLGNGQSLDLWDLIDTSGETHWATVLSPDGSERVVSVEPLAPGASHFQTSPTTGQRYAGQWIVRIPSLNATFTVTAKPVLQEVVAGVPFTPGINESDASVHGTYQNKPVSGEAYVEQFGIWQ